MDSKKPTTVETASDKPDCAPRTCSESGLKLELFSALEESLRYAGQEAWWNSTAKARDAMVAARKLAEINEAKPTPNVGADAPATDDKRTL